MTVLLGFLSMGFDLPPMLANAVVAIALVVVAYSLVVAVRAAHEHDEDEIRRRGED